MRKFFVVGLPRSRTYWMSVFLYCSHEAYHYNENYSEFMLSKSIGDSTTCYPWIKDWITDHPVVVIERDIQDCFESSKELFPTADIKTLEFIKTELDSIENCLRVKYDDIDDRLEEIWNYCHESEFNKARADGLKTKQMENYALIESVKKELELANVRNA